MSTIRILDKEFTESISESLLQARIHEMAAAVSAAYLGNEPLILSVLNGAFIFTADLIRQLQFDSEVQFVRVSSYAGGLESSGKVKELIGLNQDITGRSILITEDIVDTGHTIEWLRKDLLSRGAADVKVASLLFKKEAFGYSHEPEFIGFTIPNEFVVGYGLDYGEHGRHLRSIWKLKV